jgi:hypothetical protein
MYAHVVPILSCVCLPTVFYVYLLLINLRTCSQSHAVRKVITLFLPQIFAAENGASKGRGKDKDMSLPLLSYSILRFFSLTYDAQLDTDSSHKCRFCCCRSSHTCQQQFYHPATCSIMNRCQRNRPTSTPPLRCSCTPGHQGSSCSCPRSHTRSLQMQLVNHHRSV